MLDQVLLKRTRFPDLLVVVFGQCLIRMKPGLCLDYGARISGAKKIVDRYFEVLADDLVMGMLSAFEEIEMDVEIWEENSTLVWRRLNT